MYSCVEGAWGDDKGPGWSKMSEKVATAKRITVLPPSASTASSTATFSATFSADALRIDLGVESKSVKDIENAVYAHIRAVRALGRTRIRSLDIAEALQLPLSAVEQALEKLASKGVKVIG
jgi:hypothetical protein